MSVRNCNVKSIFFIVWRKVIVCNKCFSNYDHIVNANIMVGQKWQNCTNSKMAHVQEILLYQWILSQYVLLLSVIFLNKLFNELRKLRPDSQR